MKVKIKQKHSDFLKQQAESYGMTPSEYIEYQLENESKAHIGQLVEASRWADDARQICTVVYEIVDYDRLNDAVFCEFETRYRGEVVTEVWDIHHGSDRESRYTFEKSCPRDIRKWLAEANYIPWDTSDVSLKNRDRWQLLQTYIDDYQVWVDRSVCPIDLYWFTTKNSIKGGFVTEKNARDCAESAIARKYGYARLYEIIGTKEIL